jgi:hypothetical protein
MTNQVLSRNLSQIREYTKSNEELGKSHHFLYNSPINKNENRAEVIIIGLNPGETDKDFDYKGNLPTEESSEFNFHEENGRGSSSKRWFQLCEQYAQTDRIVLTEFFFWSSPQVGEEEEKGVGFSERFGYKFKDCPHFNFCRDKNIELIKVLNPRLILCPGVENHKLFASIYDLDQVGTFRCNKDKRQRQAIVHYELRGVPFVFTPHWRTGFVSNLEKDFIIEYLEKIIQ